jgi:hypothetical protein
MIQLDFLAAADGTPLTKSFTATGPDAYEVAPYPFVKLFNSSRVDIESTADLYTALQSYARSGHCLLKGQLTQQLRASSRQGSTNPSTNTQFLVLDLDFHDGWGNVDHFLKSLDPEFADVSYVFQHSASAGIRYPTGLRGHVFMMLSQPLLPATIKKWLQWCNLSVTGLRNQIQLSANGTSLRFPLDITTCQNDKLIYISQPQCSNFDDPIEGQRFEYVQRTHDKIQVMTSLRTMNPAVIERQLDEVRNDLRQAAGLPKSRATMRETRGVEYLAKPDVAVVTGVKQARSYVYLNLNHGDSWAYYFPEDNPEFLFNFKGEPTVRLKDIAPDFYQEYRAQCMRKVRSDRDFAPFVFRDRLRDTYYNVIEHSDGRLEFSKASSITKLHHFMLQYDEAPPEVVPDWEVTFDPTTLKQIDHDARWLNTFCPTQFLLNARTDSDAVIPPVINKIITSVMGNDEKCRDHFLHWLAFLFQTRRKPGTAWILHGVHGTGKGVLFSKILKPLFGSAHVLEVTGQVLEDQFNGPVEQALLLGIDEFHHESARSSSSVMNKLKNLITEEDISIRAMRTDTYMVKNHTAVILMTNHPDPVALATTDRRFNVPPAQETPLVLTEAEIAGIADELAIFADFLGSYAVSEAQVRRVIMTDARTRMIAASMTSVERFFDKFRTGDLNFFAAFIDIKMPMQDQILYFEFDRVVKSWIDDFEAGRHSTVSLHDLRSVFHYIIGTPTAPAKLKRMLDVYRVDYRSSPSLAIGMQWAIDEEQLEQYHKQRTERLSSSANITSIRAA